MRGIYSFIFTLGLVLTLPWEFWRVWRGGGRPEGFQERLGRYGSKLKQAITNRRVIWLHVARAEEVNLCTQLIRAIESRAPNLTVVVSASTPGRMAILKRKLPSRVVRVYFPIDRRRWVQRAFAVFAPRAVVLIGMEVWPNFLWQARRRRVPVLLVSPEPGAPPPMWWRFLPGLLRRVVGSLTGVACESEEDAQTLYRLGCDQEAVRVVGKFTKGAAELDGPGAVNGLQWRQPLGIPAEARLLVGGHTHAGEERVLAEAFARLRSQFPELFLVVVPHRRKRAEEAARDVAGHGVQCVFRTGITPDRPELPQGKECLVVNTKGDLRQFYEQASVVFVGKSLKAEGGHNPLEPALAGKPIVFGPHMQDHEQVAGELLARRGAFQVASGAELEQTLARLLSDETLARETGRAAQEVAREHLGWIDLTMDMILQALKEKGVPVVEA